MTGTVLDHPAVRDYLRALDDALVGLPAGQAGELREQIRAHLEDALRVDPDEAEVAEVMRRLGAPSDVVADAAAGAAPVAPTPTRMERPRRRLPRPGWPVWTAIAGLVVLVGSVAGYGIAVATAPALVANGGGSSWWFAPDRARQVNVEADGRAQSTVPIRSGQRQGFVVTVENPGDWTETILGAAPGVIGPGGPGLTIGVSTMDPDGHLFPPNVYVSPGAIPPHQSRVLRILWTSTSCLMSGGSQGIDQIALRVRVGWFTRTEVVALDQGWALSGPSQNRCS